jgi:transposase
MGTVRTDEFRRDAVRIALTSGLSRQQVADDLGVGKSTLNKWVTAHRDTDVVSSEDRDLVRENERLRRENRILKEERDILKKGETIFRHWSEDNGRTSSLRAKSHEVQVRPLPGSVCLQTREGKNIVGPSRSTGCVRL